MPLNQSVIIVDSKEKTLELKALSEIGNHKTILKVDAFLGRNGITDDKKEGDGKTPFGTFELGLIFGTHNRENLQLDKEFEYIKINENLYWVDDVNSKYYNQLVDATKASQDFKSAEHLNEYKIQYEYAIEIKANPNNIPGKGSAIFLHCSNNNSTAGCVAIKREDMIKLLKNIKKDTIIVVK